MKSLGIQIGISPNRLSLLIKAVLKVAQLIQKWPVCYATIASWDQWTIVADCSQKNKKRPLVLCQY